MLTLIGAAILLKKTNKNQLLLAQLHSYYK